jgi:hypothetical protein
MFSDPRWHVVGRHRWVGDIDGAKHGAVLATKSPPYETFALNAGDNKSLLEALHGGKIARAYVVAAEMNGGLPKYCAAVDAEAFQAVLARQVPRPGRYGDFWTMYLSEFTDDEWTM